MPHSSFSHLLNIFQSSVVLLVFSDLEGNMCVILVTLLTLSDGPHADPSMVRPTGPNQMVNRMQNPAGVCLIRVTDVITNAC